MRSLRVLLVTMLAACGGGSGGDASECRASSECADGLECAGPNDPQVCGIAPREGCASDTDCGPGARCHALSDTCSADNVGSECRAPCTGDPECGEGFRCDAGACVATLCDAGYTCAGREECAPSRLGAGLAVHARHHGCFAVACSSDLDCGTRFCVNGSCQDDVGSCTPPSR